MKRTGWALLALVVVLGLALTACRHSAGAGTGAKATGTYKLATIDGKPLPCTPSHQGGAPEVRSGAITLNDDGTFTSVMRYGSPDGKETGRDFSGSYTHRGNQFTLQWKGAGTTTATLETDVFTMNNEGLLFAYRK